jgi:hypothetical protein
MSISARWYQPLSWDLLTGFFLLAGLSLKGWGRLSEAEL